MLLCKARSLTRAHIEVGFGDHGAGFLGLEIRDGDKFVSLTRNMSADEPLKYALPPQSDVAVLGIWATSLPHSGEKCPVFLDVRQNGDRLPIIDGNTGVGQNGGDPYERLELKPWAPHGVPKSFYFSVRFV